MPLPHIELSRSAHDTENIKLFSGRANPQLAQEIARYLGTELGGMVIKNFSDGETYVQVQESVRGRDVFVIQPTCAPVNENLMELLLMVDALRRASANSITAVIPYYGYARQDRKTTGREAISAKLAADLIATAGVTRVVAMDLHTGQLQGFFNTLTDHLYATPVLFNYIRHKNLTDPVVVSPDAGGVERARVFAKKLHCPIAIIDKRRSAHNVSEVYHVIGDVRGKSAILVDDMIDTAGTICSGADLLMQEGAREVYAVAAHPVFSGPAVDRLAASAFTEVIVTNSIPLKEAAQQVNKIKQLSIASLMGEAIARIHDAESISEMFE
ncbi:MAG: ribose-phosphate pyrophosphokinase [Candidatus Melainabacteria bacterium]|nr:ribose-phosphate pyrophosphokinase [Candidatus Melainabacteria bacterium]